MEYYIGIDVGGTRKTGALADGDGNLLHTERRATDRAGGAEAGVALIRDIAGTLLDVARERGLSVARIGIGFGGPVDAATGTVRLSHHVPGWENLPLGALLEQALGLPVVVDNDCNAAALGEWSFGAGRGTQHLLYVNIGTGIGGGVVSHGSLVRGVSNTAGEIGHMTLDPTGPVCTCGRRGCLESYCSGPSIARRARERAAAAQGRTQLTGASTSEDVFALAVQGDPAAGEIVAETADLLARALGAAAVIVNPEVVVLGGGVAEVGEVLLAPVRDRLPCYLLDLHAAGLRIVQAALGYDAGVVGAVALALEGV